jgi:hypothetical protein
MDDLFRSLPKIIRAAGNAPEVVEAAAMAAWKRVAGEGLRWNAIPFRLYQKTLIIAVPDAGWQKQLESMSGQLLFRLNSVLGQAVVTYIEFRIDPATVKTERQALGRKKTERAAREKRALKAVSGGVQAAANEIRDEALRARFLIAAGSCLCRIEEKDSKSGSDILVDREETSDRSI